MAGSPYPCPGEFQMHIEHKGEAAVRVVSPNPSIRALLEITKLVKLFPPYDSVERAMGEA